MKIEILKGNLELGEKKIANDSSFETESLEKDPYKVQNHR